MEVIMAVKNNNQNAESNGGFKTVAFGFDKNDVNMYIASLRKKMKTMEEEFEQKLSSALENPAASSDALKHEREVIRAETEKLWGEKLNERNQILKQQQTRINELEDELRISQEKVASLRTQLSAATSDGNSDGVISARAAKAYMQFTRELRFISSSVEKTLEKMQQQWKGEFGEAAAKLEVEENTANYADAFEASENAQTSTTTNVQTNVQASSAVKTWSEALELDEAKNEDPINSLIADISEPEGSGYAVGIAPQSEITMEIDSDLLAEPLPEAPAAPKPIPPAPAKTASQKPAEAQTTQQRKPEKANVQEKKPEAAKPAAETAPKAGAKRISMPESKPAAETVSHPVIEEVDFDLLLEKPKEQPVPEAAVSDDFDSLLTDDSPTDDSLAFSPAAESTAQASVSHTAPRTSAPAVPAKNPGGAKPKIEMDDDLSALLAEDDLSDLLVAPADNTVGANDDFEKLMTEPKPEPDYGEDIFFAEEDRTVPKGDDLDATFLSDIVINPGEIKDDLGEMLVSQEKADEEAFKDMFVTAADDSERNDGLGINVGGIDFGMDSADDLSAKAKAAKNTKKDDDLFDFSFLAVESDDEDDMSTDVSFPGML